MQFRNPELNDDGTIDCEVNHPEFGWIPFTASPSDVEPHGREVFSKAMDTNPPKKVIPTPIFDAVKAAKEARLKRDGLLRASDWSQMPDAPVDKSVWATYRQALRDVPQQAGFPENITWPEAPQ